MTKKLIQHIRVCVFRGLLTVTPLLLCTTAVYLLYIFIDQKIMGFLGRFFEIRKVPGLGIFLVLAALYLTGLIVSNIIGRGLFKLIEGITRRIPFLKSIYEVGRQITHSFLATDGAKQVFKKVVLLRLDNELRAPAFVMSSLVDRQTAEELLLVFIPTAPTPTGGFIFIVKAAQTVDPGWTVEESLKLILSMGIISPGAFHSKPS
jgi:uncharacterized membrane protein